MPKGRIFYIVKRDIDQEQCTYTFQRREKSNQKKILPMCDSLKGIITYDTEVKRELKKKKKKSTHCKHAPGRCTACRLPQEHHTLKCAGVRTFKNC